jgi:type I restriction enzyme M protein
MPTKNIWYYKLEPGRVIGKKEPLSDLDLEEFLTLQSQRIESEKSWVTEFKSIDQKNVDLYGYNPNIVEKQHKSADTIIDGITNKLSDLSKLVKKLGEIE